MGLGGKTIILLNFFTTYYNKKKKKKKNYLKEIISDNIFLIELLKKNFPNYNFFLKKKHIFLLKFYF